ncbi:hypothetical protein D3C71_1744380 [compost metagenome]
MSLISIDINPLLNAALGIFMWMMPTKALAHRTKPYVVPDNLTLGVPPLPFRNGLSTSPNGAFFLFIQEVNSVSFRCAISIKLFSSVK